LFNKKDGSSTVSVGEKAIIITDFFQDTGGLLSK